jgi:trk system potassium uptake protein TrkA
MYFLIIGAGKVGSVIASWLVSEGHEIVVVDKNPDKILLMEEILGSVTVSGDATDSAVLARAGANRADVMIATTNNDGINLTTCQLGKHHFGIKRPISIVTDRENAGLFKNLGIDLTIVLTEIVLNHVQNDLSNPGLNKLIQIQGIGNKSLVTLTVSGDQNMKGKSINNLQLPTDSIISLVINRDGTATVPTGETMVRTGDQIVVLTTAKDEELLRNIFVGNNGA